MEIDPPEPSMFSKINKIVDSDYNEKIVLAMAKAVQHAKSVALRGHIKADRFERVQQFCVSLRRELSLIDRMSANPVRREVAALLLIEALCDKAIWFDIGVLEAHWNGASINRISQSLVEDWLRRAMTMVRFRTDVQTDAILADIEELQVEVKALQLPIREAERINREADLVIGKLCEVLTEA